ncbi:MAG TPA: TrkA family potassium uptake protein, partial [Acidimicrobiales bacterium]|nr:TrkA family potassium uptake protein [Acidimicrobiales bacterium]
MRVVIAGAGAVGRHLAMDLAERGHKIWLIDQSRSVTEKAVATAPGVTVVLGDACELWVLEKAQVDEADVVVAATGDDEDNLVVSLLSKQEYAVPRVLARVNHPKNEWMFTEQWGVDDAVSPPHILTSLVEEAVTVGDLVRLLRLERGQVGLVELTMPEDSANAGRPLYELRLPPDSAIVAILRDGHVVIPQPESVLTGGDEVLALVDPEAEDLLRRAIVGQQEAEAS